MTDAKRNEARENRIVAIFVVLGAIFIALILWIGLAVGVSIGARAGYMKRIEDERNLLPYLCGTMELHLGDVRMDEMGRMLPMEAMRIVLGNEEQAED